MLASYDRSLSHKTKDTLVSSKTLKRFLSKKCPLQKNHILLDDKPYIYIKPPKPFIKTNLNQIPLTINGPGLRLGLNHGLKREPF